MQDAEKSPFEDELRERDYQPVDGFNFPTEQGVKSLNEGSNNKNYVFRNCNVTINEEGKAIELLQEQEKRRAKMQEANIKMIEGIMTAATTAISSLVEAKRKKIQESMAENTGEPVMTNPKKPTRKRPSAKKKASVKKVTTKVGKK
jgi:hypothetical protein